MEGLGLVGGMLVLLTQSAVALWIGWRLACRWWADDLLATVCAALVLSTSLVVVVLEVLGTLGLLNRGAPLALTLVLGALVLRFVPPRRPAELELFRWRPRHLPDHALAAGLVATVAVLLGTVALSAERWRHSFDSFASHLPVAVQFVQRHDTWFFPYASPVLFSAHYPANAELLEAWVLAPIWRDVYVQLALLPGVALLVAATAMLARTLGARTGSALGVALLLPAMPRSLVEQVGTNMQDLLTTGAIVATFAFAARRWTRQAPVVPDLVLGGLAAGMAMGTRYGAGLTVAPALILLVLPTLLPRGERRVDVRAATRHSVIVIGAMVVVGGYFYLRNQVYGGSPIYPESVPWKTIEAHERFAFDKITTYAQLGWRPDLWRRALRFIWEYDGIVAVGLLASAVAMPVVALLRRRRTLRAWAWAFVPLSIVAAFAVTPAAPGLVEAGEAEPFTQALNLRYGIPLVPLTAAAIAAELRRRSVAVDRAVIASLLLVGAATSIVKAELPVGWSRLLPVGLVAVAVVLGATHLLRRCTLPQAAGLLGAAGLALAVATPAIADHIDGTRAGAIPMEAERRALEAVEGPIAVAGFCQIYGFYDPDLGRHVEYLTGDDETIDRPLFATEEAWLGSLRRHGTVAVVLGSDICYSELGLPYRDWVLGNPDVFRPVPTDRPDSVFLVDLTGMAG